MNGKLLIITSIMAFSLAVRVSEAQIALSNPWKFSKGDDLAWAQPGFDDKSWATISPDKIWENQGYDNYDGFGWYRTTVTVPSSFKKEAERLGGLVLNVAKVDDADETFWNGKLIGKTGGIAPNYESKYSDTRAYIIPLQDIVWDKPNSIAVRVFDGGGGGGIYDSPLQIRQKTLDDFISVNASFKEADHISKEKDVNVDYTFNSTYFEALKGTFVVTLVSDFGQQISVQSKPVQLEKNGKASLGFTFNGLQPGFYKVKANLNFGNMNRNTSLVFGVQPEAIVSPTDAQPDFEAYWQKAKAELATVPPQYKVTLVDSLSKGNKNIYVVEMRSLGNVRVKAWYAVPKKPGKYPAVLHVQGYSSFLGLESIYGGDDMVSLGLNIRGHGFSKEDFNPWPIIPYILSGIEDKEKYVYRGAYMDCRRALDFLFSRPEVDTTKVAVEGGSQGGALSIATAALNPERIKACAPQIPFLSDFKDYFVVAYWPGNEFKKYIDTEHKTTWPTAYYTLSYIDVKNLAPYIKCPVLMSVGLLDEICPPHINFAAYNQLKVKKEYRVYPDEGHSVPQSFHQYKYEWMKKEMGVK